MECADGSSSLDDIPTSLVVEPVAHVIMENVWSVVMILALWVRCSRLSVGTTLEPAIARTGQHNNNVTGLFSVSGYVHAAHPKPATVGTIHLSCMR